MTTVVRRANLNDVEHIAAVHCAAALVGYRSIFPLDADKPTPETLALEWRGLLEDASVGVLVAEDPTVVGCVGLAPDPEVPSGWSLVRLYVAPDRWSQGIGALLHSRVLLEAHDRGLGRLNLWVLEGNARARSMYERRGWTLVPGATYENGTFEPSVLDVLYERDLADVSSA